MVEHVQAVTPEPPSVDIGSIVVEDDFREEVAQKISTRSDLEGELDRIARELDAEIKGAVAAAVGGGTPDKSKAATAP